MSTVATTKGGGNFTPAPEDNHVARCIWAIDLGTQPGGQYKPRHQVLLRWELPLAPPFETDEGESRLFTVNKRFTLSLHENSALRPFLQSWRGQALTPEEEEGFQIGALVGKACMLNVVHNTKDGKTYANIASVARLPQGIHCPQATNKLIHYEIEQGEDDVFRSLPDWVKGLITAAPEWGKSNGHAHEPPPHDDDDDIPF